MKKVIRVKQENAEKIQAAIPDSKIVPPPPYTDWGVGDYLIPGRTGESWEDWGDFNDVPAAVNMIGLELPEGMSGTQANKVISSLKREGEIQ